MRKYLADYYCFTTHNYDKSLNIYKEILTSKEYKTDNYIMACNIDRHVNIIGLLKNNY